VTYHIQFVDDLMTIVGDDGDGFDACEVDPQRPWDAVETLAKWGREYDLDAVGALGELRRHVKNCR
jgi:hypothetical protein